MSLIDTEQVLKKIQREAEKEIVAWGSGLILEQLGFVVDKYTKQISFKDNTHMVDVLFKEEEVKEIVKKINSRMNYNLKHHLLDVLEHEYLPKIIAKTQAVITKDAELYVTQKIQSRIFSEYSNKLEAKLTDEIMSDPKIREILLGKL